MPRYLGCMFLTGILLVLFAVLFMFINHFKTVSTTTRIPNEITYRYDQVLTDRISQLDVKLRRLGVNKLTLSLNNKNESSLLDNKVYIDENETMAVTFKSQVALSTGLDQAQIIFDDKRKQWRVYVIKKADHARDILDLPLILMEYYKRDI